MYSDYLRRNNMDYSIINFEEPTPLNGNSIATSSSSSNLLNLRFNGCMKEACCTDETTSNEKYAICVPNFPPNDGTSNSGYKYFIADESWKDVSNACSSAGYSLVDLSCNINQAGFTTMSNTSDTAKPNEPNEFANYNLYK